MKKFLATALAVCMTVSLAACGSSAQAVSYTHLDVYKRQAVRKLDSSYPDKLLQLTKKDGEK